MGGGGGGGCSSPPDLQIQCSHGDFRKDLYSDMVLKEFQQIAQTLIPFSLYACI